MKKIISLLLALCILLGTLSMGAFAVDFPAGDVSRNYKVTAYDALMIQSYLHGEISFDDEQIQLALATIPSITKLSTAHVMATLFTPLRGKSEVVPEEDGMYHIREAKDMELLRTYPKAAFKLENDIDMELVDWTPFAFYGFLNGSGYTIKNMTATAGTDAAAGVLFTKLGSDSNKTAVVENLTLKNCILLAKEQTTQLGAICGCCCGTITDCESVNVLATGGVYGDGMQLGNCGQISEDGMEERNMVNPVLDKRQLVVDYMGQMARIKWRVPREVCFVCEQYESPCNCAEGSVDQPGHRYYADKVYTGMPYCSYGSGLENFLENATLGANDVYTLDDALTINYGPNTEFSLVHPIKPEWPSYFCNDSATAVQWAWAQVAPTVSFSRAEDMIPSGQNIQNFGIVKLGNYYIDEDHPTQTSWADGDEYRSILQDEDGDIIPERLTDLYNSYLQLQPGDAVVYADELGSHARLVHHIELDYDGFGQIDPEFSKVVCIEQCGGTYNKAAKRGLNGMTEGEHTTWKYMSKYSFTDLAAAEQLSNLTKCPNVYVPITCKELQGFELPQAYVKFKGSSTAPYEGVVASNYRIVGTKLTIDGQTDAQQTGCYGPYAGLNYVYQFNTQKKNVKAYSYYDRWLGQYVDFTGYLGKFYEGIDESGLILNNKCPDTELCGASRLVYHSVDLAKHADAFSGLSSGGHSYTLTVNLVNGMSYTFTGFFWK